MSQRRLFVAFISVLVPVLVFTGCPPKKKLKIEDVPVVEATETPTPEPTPAVNASDVTINQEWAEIPNLEVVQFAYDSAQLDDASKAVLRKNVAVIKKLPATVTVRVEGHCDSRGTVEYNIALGQRRAQAAASFYVTSGIAKSRVKSISFGHERLLCSETSEDCHARNRRVVTKIRNDQPITINTDTLK